MVSKKSIRNIKSEEITESVRKAFIEANVTLSDSLKSCISNKVSCETSCIAKSILKKVQENIEVAKKINVPICQDTGMAVVFVKLGQDVHIDGETLNDAINRGVSEAYTKGGLRLSVVKDPLRRVNTNDNAPAVIHMEMTAGKNIEIICVPKGFGSENSSRLKMFEPSASEDDIINFIVETVKIADSNPCPPVVAGVGIGGDFEYSALLAKRALTRDIGVAHKDKFYKSMEEKALEKINMLDIGPQGFGGRTTALSVNIETFPTHIAGLPVAVNICCHVYRHKKFVL